MENNLNFITSLRFAVIFAVALSLSILAGPIASHFQLPTMNFAHANTQLCQTTGSSGACSEYWYPAGPAMNSLYVPVFADSSSEYTNLQSPTPSIDFTDSPCQGTSSSGVCGILGSSPNFLLTAPVPQAGYYSIEFLLANNFWGCNFSFGNSACGIQIRQGIAHMIDKTLLAANDPAVAGTAAAIDNPVPTSSAGGLLTPNPCGYDTIMTLTGPNCVVGAPGGTAYHVNAATGANGFSWLFAPGSTDLNLAAQHFVNAGLATGYNPTTSVLTGISAGATSNVPSFFIINSDPARLDLGNSLSEEICYLFTGSYTVPCTYLNTILGPIMAYPGLTTNPTAVNLSWWMYTAAYSYVPYFDDSLYFTYNSRFVSASCASPGTSSCITQQVGGGYCSNQSLQTSSGSNFMYLCSSGYDSLSSQTENAPCLTAQGDPVKGAASNLPTSPGNGLCSGTSQLSAVSAGIQAEANFGANEFSLPVFERSVQFGYLNNGWSRVINNADVGLPNFFTWLDAYNPSPPQTGTIRQGFSESTRSVNPYVAETPQDGYIVRNVYDSLLAADPLSPNETINWMTELSQTFPNSSLGYPAPPHTLITYRFTFPKNIYFQDGRPVTMYDVAFSYLSLVASGAFLGIGASMMTGFTIISSAQFDIGVDSLGPFVLPNLANIPILPGRYWTSAGSAAWNGAAVACNTVCPMAQYTLSGSTVNCSMNCSPFSAALMTVNSSDINPTFDPIANHMFIGSGPWQCGTVSPTSGSGSCTSTGNQDPPVGGSYTLTRYGAGFAPGTSTTGIYFHSAGDLAVFLWACPGAASISITCFSAVVFCYGLPLGSCLRYQQGIGASPTGVVGDVQYGYMLLHFNNDWLNPYNWISNPPLGIIPITPAGPGQTYPTDPVLYEGSYTLNPASVAGCSSPYPTGGYDC